ncbi:MAG: Crp/Fnr family transcriptional regulator [Gammaproteobacteria bacterium]|nr:Crp/Fnr family transcriptional regulator [Gammaproteobacteria bacterium]
MTDPSTVNQLTVSPGMTGEHIELLQKNRWFRGLPADAISAMVTMARLKRLEDGQRLHAQGDLPDGLYGVSKGSIRVSSSGADGREALLTVLAPGNWFGEISLFDGLPRTHDAHAMGATELLFIPRREFNQLLERQPELYPHFMRLLCRRLRLSFNMLEDSALLPLPARLAKRLLMHAQYYGDLGMGTERLAIQLSQETLGLMLNSSRQSINRLLKQFEQAGWVQIHYSQISILDEEALTRVANGSEQLPK